jgi:hypothetical protein
MHSTCFGNKVHSFQYQISHLTWSIDSMLTCRSRSLRFDLLRFVSRTAREATELAKDRSARAVGCRIPARAAILRRYALCSLFRFVVPARYFDSVSQTARSMLCVLLLLNSELNAPIRAYVWICVRFRHRVAGVGGAHQRTAATGRHIARHAVHVDERQLPDARSSLRIKKSTQILVMSTFTRDDFV